MQAALTDGAAVGGGPVGMRGDSVSERDADAAAAVLAKAATIRTSEDGGPMRRTIRASSQPEAAGMVQASQTCQELATRQPRQS